jgi:cytochrome c-type protein NapB
MQSSSHIDDHVQQSYDPLLPNPHDFTRRYTILIVLGLVSVSTTGYFLGLTSPMTAGDEQPLAANEALQTGEHQPASSTAIPAPAYSDMPFVLFPSREQRDTRLTMLQQPSYDIKAKVDVNKTERLASLADRDTRRAYDGASPTIPHPIDQLDSDGCMACHGEGLRSDTLRVGKIPHPFYSLCTQCHVEQHARFATASATFENTFAGVATPTSGGRAFQGDSPVVPHTTWMREALQNLDPAADWVPPAVPHTTWFRNDCHSCHGRTAAPGMGSSHLWRTDCMRCHGESPQLNEPTLDDDPIFKPFPTNPYRPE